MAQRPYFPRLLDPVVEELFEERPAIMLTGGRATGKTTTASRLAAEVVRFDQPGTAASFRADPDAALARAERPLLIDEWQEVPEVLPAIKRIVDADPTPTQFLLTGSVRADLAHETWAGTGRVIRLPMHPLTERELEAGFVPDAEGFIARLARSGIDELGLPASVPNVNGYVDRMARGSFPDVAYTPLSPRTRMTWLTSYVDDLVTRDAALVGEAKDPAKLRRYVAVLAEHTAGQPTDRSLIEAAGINAKTAAGYDQLLTNLHVLEQVPAWSTNRLKRLVRGRKRYLVDTGLAMAAAGLNDGDIVRDVDMLGRLFDTFALMQLRPELALGQPSRQAFHLRVADGRHEVDLVVELGAGRLVGIEVKATAAPSHGDAKHLRWLRDELGSAFVAGAVLHAGPAMFQLDDRIYAIPLCAVWA